VLDGYGLDAADGYAADAHAHHLMHAYALDAHAHHLMHGYALDAHDLMHMPYLPTTSPS